MQMQRNLFRFLSYPTIILLLSASVCRYAMANKFLVSKQSTVARQVEPYSNRATLYFHSAYTYSTTEELIGIYPRNNTDHFQKANNLHRPNNLFRIAENNFVHL